ncbi:MAG: hypothetical protein ABH879_02685 [archaeon]
MPEPGYMCANAPQIEQRIREQEAALGPWNPTGSIDRVVSGVPGNGSPAAPGAEQGIYADVNQPYQGNGIRIS